MISALRWLLRRLALAVLVVLGAATVAFAALHLAPGDPVRAVIGTLNPSQDLVDRVRVDLGLDQPLATQYGQLLGRLVTGDLGESYQLHRPVAEVIASEIGWTAQLAMASLVLALAPSVLLAVTTAGRRPALRRLSTVLELITASSPTFWIGTLLLAVFSFRLRLFPAAGGDGIEGLVLPAAAQAVGLIGIFTQVLRQSMERALDEPFALSARARGTGETALRLRHALRHALIPVVTLSGWITGALFSGAVVVETVFSRPGLGRTLVTAILGRDLPVVIGVVVVAAALFTLINLVVDLLYRVVDPRLREQAA
ncbi:ABC transporter permease [Micromonospora wenchangensis]|uniref:ABC transporter permease n=1 Tax=Micromonospora wenchangensis TaxID=1185415 RepID=A0A246RLJ1_9ACTN|nr:ABC transporter permease [Micromonospora wenchangensis]OWV05805.1 ABC transporter permease [Micromonospora wenchangensis]